MWFLMRTNPNFRWKKPAFSYQTRWIVVLLLLDFLLLFLCFKLVSAPIPDLPPIMILSYSHPTSTMALAEYQEPTLTGTIVHTPVLRLRIFWLVLRGSRLTECSTQLKKTLNSTTWSRLKTPKLIRAEPRWWILNQASPCLCSFLSFLITGEAKAVGYGATARLRSSDLIPILVERIQPFGLKPSVRIKPPYRHFIPSIRNSENSKPTRCPLSRIHFVFLWRASCVLLLLPNL